MDELDDAVTVSPFDAPALTRPGALKVGDQFGPRYRVLRLLGMGGMGAVYQAWDNELTIAVALKVIRSDRGEAAAETQRRFKQELLLARQVTHKHVIRIHDLGEVAGTKYITMPFIEGADLASIIRHSGKLPIPRALAYARQIAVGLRAAHDVGVVHRDLKPANILIGADGAVITDFGIAHSLSTPDDADAGAAVVGTIRYMAPEQAQAIPVDHRADIYAFGLILYEMLAGRQWTDDSTTMEVLVAKRDHADALASPAPPDVPGAVARIIQRCIESRRENRYASVTELLNDLEGIDGAGNARPRMARSA